MSKRRIGIVPAHVVRLEQLLQLPPEHCITSASWDDERQEVRFVIEGPSMPMTEMGDLIQTVKPALRLGRATRAMLITWPNAA